MPGLGTLSGIVKTSGSGMAGASGEGFEGAMLELRGNMT